MWSGGERTVNECTRLRVSWLWDWGHIAARWMQHDILCSSRQASTKACEGLFVKRQTLKASIRAHCRVGQEICALSRFNAGLVVFAFPESFNHVCSPSSEAGFSVNDIIARSSLRPNSSDCISDGRLRQARPIIQSNNHRCSQRFSSFPLSGARIRNCCSWSCD